MAGALGLAGGSRRADGSEAVAGVGEDEAVVVAVVSSYVCRAAGEERIIACRLNRSEICLLANSIWPGAATLSWAPPRGVVCTEVRADRSIEARNKSVRTEEEEQEDRGGQGLAAN